MFKLGDQPVPGYALVRSIGHGQYGEVWEATGPGGTRLAIKIISLRENKGQIELKSIQAVKQVRHANLIPIHAIWLLDQEGKVLSEEVVARALAVTRHVQRDHTLIPDELRIAQSLSYLIICMAMADGNLEDCLREAIGQGHPGIPPAELTRYIGQAARGLDYLNSTRHEVDGTKVGIQHRDVKPANLLLLGDAVVVGDFGVATTLSEFDAMATAVLGSLAFMAPESLAQRPSQTSDQYALAITYYQLRFNQLPYDANVPLDQLIAIHKEGRLDFRQATPCERGVLKRATALEPRRRYASCVDFAEALEACFRPTIAARRSATPALVGLALAALLSGLALWYFDPAGWFRAPVLGNPSDSEQMYTISFPAGEVRGELQILRAGNDAPEPPISLSQINTVKLRTEDQLKIHAESENPFLQPLDAQYTLAELEQLHWTIRLQPIPSQEIEQQLGEMLDSAEQSQALTLWQRARKFDANFNAIAQPRSQGIGTPVGFQLSPHAGEIGLAQRDDAGDHATWVEYSSFPWRLTTLPTCEAERSPIESLLFMKETPRVVVTRQRSIWLWEQGAADLQPLWNASGADDAWRFLVTRVSLDGRWIAAGDSTGSVRLWDTRRPATQQLVGETTLEAGLVDLHFDRESQRLIVVTDSVPVLQIDLSSLPDASSTPVSLSTTALAIQPEFDGPAIVRAARCGGDSLALAGEESLVFAPGLLSATPQPFSALRNIPGGSLFMLVGAAQAERVLSASDGDPPGLVWDAAAGTEYRTLAASQLVSSIRDAALSPDGRWCAVSTHNGALQLLDLEAAADSPTAWHALESSTLGYYKYVGFAPDSRYLWAVSQPRTANDTSALLQWDLRRLQLVWSAE